MASFATPEDVEAVWQQALTDAQTIATAQWLVYASALIRSRVPTVDDRITAGTLDAELTKFVAVSMVLRMLRNPEGIRQESETLGSWSHSATYSEAISSGRLFLTDEELGLLKPLKSGAFSVIPSVPTPREPCLVSHRL